MLKLMHKLNKIYIIINKYVWFIPLLSIVTNIKDYNFFKIINKIIKVLIIVNIILGVSVLLYFTDLVTPLNTTYSIYYDLIEPYIELLKSIWNKIINYFNSNPIIDSDIKNQINDGIKSGVKEALNEILDEMDDNLSNTNHLKKISFISSIIFFTYFIFYLPSSPELLTKYNWFNQSLIEVKILLKDSISYLFSNPGNPPISPVDPNTIIRFPEPISTSNSSVGSTTVTGVTEVGVQTNINGIGYYI